jgi:hypothetical protein
MMRLVYNGALSGYAGKTHTGNSFHGIFIAIQLERLKLIY